MIDKPLSAPSVDKSAAVNIPQPLARDPDLYMPSINGRVFTSVRFGPTQYGDRTHHDLTFRMGREPIGRLTGLNATELVAALGPRNLVEMRRQEERGSLRGEQLHDVQGVAPLEKWQELRPPSQMREMNSVAQGDSVFSREDATILEQVPALRRRVREDFDQERERLGLQGQPAAEPSREPSPEAARQATGPAGGASARDGTLSPPEIQADAEQARERQAALRGAVHAQYQVRGGLYLYRDPPNALAFEDKGARLVAATNDQRVAQAMAEMAEAKGWARLQVAGHPDFRREVWLHASTRGLQVSGFSPTDRDRQALAQRQAQTLGNRIEPTPDRSHDPVEAARAHRQPEAVGKTGPQRAIAAVASAVIDARVADPVQRGLLKAAIDARLQTRAHDGRLPEVGMYDKQAPSLRERPAHAQREEPAKEHTR